MKLLDYGKDAERVYCSVFAISNGFKTWSLLGFEKTQTHFFIDFLFLRITIV